MDVRVTMDTVIRVGTEYTEYKNILDKIMHLYSNALDDLLKTENEWTKRELNPKYHEGNPINIEIEFGKAHKYLTNMRAIKEVSLKLLHKDRNLIGSIESLERSWAKYYNKYLDLAKEFVQSEDVVTLDLFKNIYSDEEEE